MSQTRLCQEKVGKGDTYKEPDDAPVLKEHKTLDVFGDDRVACVVGDDPTRLAAVLLALARTHVGNTRTLLACDHTRLVPCPTPPFIDRHVNILELMTAGAHNTELGRLCTVVCVYRPSNWSRDVPRFLGIRAACQSSKRVLYVIDAPTEHNAVAQPSREDISYLDIVFLTRHPATSYPALHARFFSSYPYATFVCWMSRYTRDGGALVGGSHYDDDAAVDKLPTFVTPETIRAAQASDNDRVASLYAAYEALLATHLPRELIGLVSSYEYLGDVLLHGKRSPQPSPQRTTSAESPPAIWI